MEGNREQLVRSLLGVLDQCFIDGKFVISVISFFPVIFFVTFLRKEINPRE